MARPVNGRSSAQGHGVKTEDWWSMHSDLPRLVRLRLAEEGIEVPVPRRDVTTRPAQSQTTSREGPASAE